MTGVEPTIERVRAIIQEIVGPSRMPVGVDADTPLNDGVWLDSVEMLELILACEREFGIVFDGGGQLAPEALATVGSLANLVHTRLPR